MARYGIGEFKVWDYLVFALVLLVSAGIGIYYGCTGGKQKTTKEFLMADRKMRVLPVALSLLASFMSAITLLGTPAEIYQFGTQYWVIWVGYCMLIPIAAHVFLPIFFKLKVTSVFEYLDLRFCRGVRIYAAICFIIQMTLYMAIVLYAPSLALNQVTGLNVWISVFSIGIVCTFYTSLGGMKAVMWTDAFQICMMFAGLIAVLIQGSIDMGGFDKIWQMNYDGHRIEFFNWDTNPFVRHTAWSLSFGGAFTWLAIYGVNQAQVQRALCVPTLRAAQMALWINLPGLTALLTICSLCGLVIYAEYKDCDPLTTTSNWKGIAADQLLPLYVMQRLSHVPGLAGLFTACLFSGALSTISSGLNSLSAVCLQDLIRNVCFPNMSESRATLVSKCLAIAFGALCIALTFVAQSLGGVLQAALALFGMIGGPVLGLYILGVIYPFANKWGAYSGLTLGLMFTFWLGVGAQIYKPCIPKPPVSVAGCPVDELNYTTTIATTTWLTTTSPARSYCPPVTGLAKFYEISYMWYSTFAVIIVNVVGWIVSLATGPATDVDPRLIFPIFDCCRCLPYKVRQILNCNLNHERKWDTDQKEVEKDNDIVIKDQDDTPPEKAANGNINYACFDATNVTRL